MEKNLSTEHQPVEERKAAIVPSLGEILRSPGDYAGESFETEDGMIVLINN